MDISEAIERIKRFCGVKTDKEIAKLFSLEPNDFSNRKRRGTLLPHIIDFGVHEGMNLDWLLTGKGQAKQTESYLSGNTGTYKNTRIHHNSIHINGDKSAPTAPAKNPLNAIEMIMKIYKSGNKGIIDLVEGNLKHFSDIIDSD